MNLNMTLIGQMITFLIFVAVTMKFIWPPVSKALAERRKKIADGLAAAERGQHDLEVAQHKAREIVQEAKSQATIVIEQANKRAHHIEEDARDAARRIVDNMKKVAQEDIDRQYNKAREELTQKVVELAITGTEHLLEHNIDKAANERLLKKLVQEV